MRCLDTAEMAIHKQLLYMPGVWWLLLQIITNY